VNNLISPPGDVAGAILVGGRSQRFGKDKVLLPFQGKPLIAHLCGILEPLVREILIVGHPRPEFEALNLRVVEDLLPDAGPLGGIYTALKSTRA
jgi:molybdopterin-guanine dinucleotide biosynthesis protein A